MGFGEFGKRAMGMMAGLALGSGVEAHAADVPKTNVEPTEQAAFTPEVIQPEWRKLQVISAQDTVPNPPPGYEAQEIPGNKYQYIEIAPVGWHKEPTPEGSIFVQDCPDGFHVVGTPEGKTYVQDNPDGSDKIQTVAAVDSRDKAKRRKDD
jgi:hypothetical protein